MLPDDCFACSASSLNLALNPCRRSSHSVTPSVAEIELGKTSRARRLEACLVAGSERAVSDDVRAEQGRLDQGGVSLRDPGRDGSHEARRRPPPWAEAYWTWKSDRTAPGEPTLTIDVSRRSGVKTPSPCRWAAISRAAAHRTPRVSRGRRDRRGAGDAERRRLHAQAEGGDVGEWINHPIRPGQTFSWGPKSSGLIAFAEKGGGAGHHGPEGQQAEGRRHEERRPARVDRRRRQARVSGGPRRGRYAMIVAEVK